MKFLKNWTCGVMASLKSHFFKALFWSIWIWFSNVWFFWAKSWHAYSKCEPKSDWYVIFKISRLELCLNLLKIPIALFNFILTLDSYFVHCKCSSRSTPRYLTEWAGISRFPCILNLIEGSILRQVGRNIINSVFWVFRHNLLALKQYDRFNKYLFICLAKTSKGIFDRIMFIIYKMICF